MKQFSLVLFLYLFRTSVCDQITKELFPIKYDLTLTPYFESKSDSRFEARVVFTFKPLLHGVVRNISLHMDSLEIESFVLLEDSNNVTKQLKVISSGYDIDEQLLRLDTGCQLSVDSTYELHINYTGYITDDGWGLYKDSFEHEGRTRFYTVTQLRPIFARRLLPCLDEPSYKARFTLRVWRQPQYTALSNMPCVDSSPMNLQSGRVLDTFAETPPMSVFLLALAVFDFASVSSPNKKFSTWTIPSKINLAEHGQRMLPVIVKAMDDIVGSTFPIPKLDQIALPKLNPVAMENWGMNTYREEFMLYKEGLFPPRTKQDVPRFTGHEVAHHWIGNLVTLQWWDWLWLSEMYAMYYEYYLPSQVAPDWRMFDQMVVDLFIPGLLEDSFNTSRPLSTHVSTNQEILAKFSGVTYTKGPALVHMINNFMTHSRANQALRTLLHERKYDTVNPTQLWDIYNHHAQGLPAAMETIMHAWTEQPGYPLVTVTIDQSEGTITLQQERFLTEGKSSDSSKWWVPLTYTYGARPNFTHTHTRVWLSPKESLTVIRLGLHINSWLLFNVQHIGFYRVNYDHQNWDRLIDSLHTDPGYIHELNRAQLLDDSFSLARAGYLSYAVPLKLALYLAQEGCYFPWAAIIPSINFLLTRLNGYPVFEIFRDYVVHLISPVYDSVGFQLDPSDSQLVQLNRVQIVTLACSLGLPACVQASRHHHYITSQEKPSLVPPGLEAVQLCTLLEDGMSTDDLLSQPTVWSKDDQVKAMPCLADKDALTEYLAKSLKEDSLTEFRVKLTAAVNRITNTDIVFTLLFEEYRTLLTRFGAKNVSSLYTQVGSFLTTNNHLIKVEALRDKVTDEEINTALKSLSATLVKRLKWIDIHVPTIESWLHTYNIQQISPSLVYCL